MTNECSAPAHIVPSRAAVVRYCKDVLNRVNQADETIKTPAAPGGAALMNYRDEHGQDHELIPVPVQSSAEHWNEILLEDGSVIRLKVVTTEVLRAEGVYDATGEPFYIVRSQNIFMVRAPAALRAPAPQAKAPA